MLVVSLTFSALTNANADETWTSGILNKSIGGIKLISNTSSQWTADVKYYYYYGCQDIYVRSSYKTMPPTNLEVPNYRLSFNLSSDCDKWIFLCVGEPNQTDHFFYGKWFYLTKGENLYFEKDLYIVNNSTKLDVTFYIGGEPGNSYSYYDNSNAIYSYIDTIPKDNFTDFYAVIKCSDFYFGEVPNKTTIKQVKRTDNKAKITLKKVNSAQKYQIKYSTSKKFKAKQTKTVTTKKTTYTIKKLKKNTKYYVKARAYGKYSGNTIYGSWSKIKTIAKK